MKIASTMELFPVPLGPMIRLNCGPGKTVTNLHVKKSLIVTLMMEPGAKPSLQASDEANKGEMFRILYSLGASSSMSLINWSDFFFNTRST